MSEIDATPAPAARFDLLSAQPIEPAKKGGFDLASAEPVNPLDSLPPPAARNPLDNLPPPSAAPMTVGRAAGLTARGVGSGVVGAVAAPLELDSLGHALGKKIIGGITGEDPDKPGTSANALMSVAGSPLDMLPGIGNAIRPLRELAQKYLGTAYPSPTALLNQGLDQAGIAQPQTGLQRAYVAGLAGLTGGALPGGQIGGLRGAVSGGLSGLSGAQAQQGAASVGMGPVGQGTAAVLGALLPGGARAAVSGMYRSMVPSAARAAPKIDVQPGTPAQDAGPISLGIKLSPTQSGGAVSRTAAGLVNEAKVNRILSWQNAPTVNARVGEDLGLPTASPDALEKAKQPAFQTYNQVKRLGSQGVDDAFRRDIAQIDDPGTGTLAGDSPDALTKLKDYYGSRTSFDAGDAVLKIRSLRRRGYANIGNGWKNPDDEIVGKGQLGIANALEDQIDRNIAARDDVPPDLIDRFRAARVQLGKIGSAEGAMKDGNIFVGNLYRQWKAGVPLSDNMRALAESWERHNPVYQDVGKIRNAGALGFGDVVVGAAGLTGLIPHEGALGVLAGRPLLRGLLASDLYQRLGPQRQPLLTSLLPFGKPSQQTLEELAARYNAQSAPMPRNQIRNDLPLSPLGTGDGPAIPAPPRAVSSVPMEPEGFLEPLVPPVKLKAAQPAGLAKGGSVKGVAAAEVKAAAHKAAPSPKNQLAPPTRAQHHAGNFKMGHTEIQGMPISIEYPKGSERPVGKSESRTMGAHYGYLKGTGGADGQQVDVMVGEDPENRTAYLVDHLNASGEWQQHRVLLGFKDLEAALRAYRSAYPDNPMGPVSEVGIPELREWLSHGHTQEPFNQRAVERRGIPREATTGESKRPGPRQYPNPHQESTVDISA
jgi:hypothetical protein